MINYGFFIIILWFICGFLTFGFLFGMFQNKYSDNAEKNYNFDFLFCFTLSLIGIFLIWIIILKGDYKYGLKFY